LFYINVTNIDQPLRIFVFPAQTYGNSLQDSVQLRVSHGKCPSNIQYDYQSSVSSSTIVLEISSSTFPPLALGTYYAAVIPLSFGSCFGNYTYFSIGACFGNNCIVSPPTTGTFRLYFLLYSELQHHFFNSSLKRTHLTIALGAITGFHVSSATTARVFLLLCATTILFIC
jgi:hypothetical protein